MKLEAGIAAENQRKLRDNRLDPDLEEKISGKSRPKAIRLTNLSQTVEFFETRADKIAGKRQGFEGHVMTDQEQERYLDNADIEAQKQTDAETKTEMENRKEALKQLQKHIEQYRINNLRDEIRDDVEETKENTHYMASRNFRQIGDVINLMEEMTLHHDDSNNAMQKNIIDACFEYYGLYLGELEKKDLRALKKRLAELKGMQKNLTRDLKE